MPTGGGGLSAGLAGAACVVALFACGGCDTEAAVTPASDARVTVDRGESRSHIDERPGPVDLAQERAEILEYLRRDESNLSEDEVRSWIRFAEDIKASAKHDLSIYERLARAIANPWVFFGFAAQGIFMMRFVVQLVASERKKRSYVPVAFWYLSLAGGLMLLAYAAQRRDPVFVFGQSLGILIYARNLILIKRRQGQLADRQEARAQRQADLAVAADNVDNP